LGTDGDVMRLTEPGVEAAEQMERLERQRGP